MENFSTHPSESQRAQKINGLHFTTRSQDSLETRRSQREVLFLENRLLPSEPEASEPVDESPEVPAAFSREFVS
jgi:hypothetical protein